MTYPVKQLEIKAVAHTHEDAITIVEQLLKLMKSTNHSPDGASVSNTKGCAEANWDTLHQDFSKN